MFQSPGPESWHPNPAFLFQEGAGPLFDMAPYYLTTLVQAFGPLSKVAAVGNTAFPTRTIGSGPKEGEVFEHQAEMEELRLSMADLMATPEVIVREGLVFDFPDSTSIIVDPRCKQLRGFVGARWIAQRAGRRSNARGSSEKARIYAVLKFRRGCILGA